MLRDDFCNCCAGTCIEYLEEGEACESYPENPRDMCGPRLSKKINSSNSNRDCNLNVNFFVRLRHLDFSRDVPARDEPVPAGARRLRGRSGERQRGDEPEPAHLRRRRILLAGAVFTWRAVQQSSYLFACFFIIVY